ncbi:MAG: hypothetical protein M1333_02175, partial [Patescibacteria group bacterium]|nr:hypothetical protein [Patescibacteria group bacterium]
GAIVSCASAVCPAGSVNLSSPSVLVGQTVTASAPGGWSGGAYNSSNSGIASVSASTIRGMSVGAANITGYGWTAPNGATNCSLAGTNLNVSQPASPTISLNPTSFTFNGVSGQANPGTQSLRISNTGSATLNWTSGGVPGKPGTWCWVSPSSGSVPAGGQQNVSVTVSNPTNIGTFSDCGIRISDPSATNNPQDVSVTYVVIAPPASCPAGQVSLASASIIKGTTTTASAPAGWSAGSFVSSNTAVASVSGSTVTGVNAGTANITGSGWTASNGATNCALAARGVTVTNIPPPGGTGASGGSFCRQVVINWIDNSIGEQGFKVYRNTNNDPASASLITPAPNF